MNRGELSNEQWEKLKPLLPPQKPQTGKPNHDHRLVVNGILWILRTGAPWRDLPERYGKWESVATRFYRWQKAGVWNQILEQLEAMPKAGYLISCTYRINSEKADKKYKNETLEAVSGLIAT